MAHGKREQAMASDTSGTAATAIAIGQMTSGIDPAANLAVVTAMIAQAAAQGAAMLFLPEMAAMVDRDRARAAGHVIAEADSRFIAGVRDAAARHGLWVHTGSAAVTGPAGDPRWRNRSLVIDAAGAVRARYDKLHLFDVTLASGEAWRESAAYAPGDALAVVDTPIGRLGLAICYDLRFAALFDALGAAGAQIIAVPSAFTVPTGRAHWEVLLRARAIEQGCFVIAAAQTGTHADGRTTWGHSLAIDPWGTVLADLGDTPTLRLVTIDVAHSARVRAELPAIAHRRVLPAIEASAAPT